MIRHFPPFRESTSALLLVDFQAENAAGSRWAVEDADQIVFSAGLLLNAARESGADIYHVRTMRRSTAEVPASEPRLPGELPLYGDASSPGSDFIPALAPLSAEHTLEKTASSAFDGTDLQFTLDRRGVRDVVLCGVWTEECVFLTAKDAVKNGLQVWLAAQACGSGSALIHQMAVTILSLRLYGGGVLNIENACAALRSQPFQAYQKDLPQPQFGDLGTLPEIYSSLLASR